MKKTDNPLIAADISTHILTVQRFIKQCEMNALKNDGVIDKEEKALLEKITKISGKYISELKKLY
ncbi:MAG: hypothetical protein J6033_01335 [Lachnospiraceae bacterium]|nr:hypothetical protein [Lachnospiraceae bacterium]